MFRKLLGVLAGVGVIVLAAGATDVSGPVSGMWTAENNPYNVIGEITVPTGQTLNIQPGVQVIFQGHYKFKVLNNAVLNAIGTEQDSIFFSAADPTSGWFGIRFWYASDSSKIQYCHIMHARANQPPDPEYSNAGGAVFCLYSSPTIQNCLINDCSAREFGAGIMCEVSHPLIKECRLVDNHVTLSTVANYGGAICCSDTASPIIINNVLEFNTAGRGGAICCLNQSNPIITNNRIINNNAEVWGGAIQSADNSTPVISNCTFVNNSAPTGGCIQVVGSVPIIKNCIMWNNAGQPIVGSPQVTYSNVQGGCPGTGNINTDPLFIIGPSGNYYLSQIGAGQTQQSPCVNTGDPTTSLIDGTTRTDQMQDTGIVDMGYHYQPSLPPPPLPPISVTLTPANPPIVIPASGGEFFFDALLTNNTDSMITFTAWIMQITPSWTWQGPMLGPVPLTLPEHAIVGRQRHQMVPSIAPPGTYTYIGYVGHYQSVKWDSSFFQYTKSTTGDGPAVDTWLCTGEPFPGEEIPPLSRGDRGDLVAVSPNPFNPVTTFSYQLSALSQVSLRVYDVSGRLISTLVEGMQEAGAHEATFDGSGLPSGIYFARLQAGDFQATQKLMLLK